MDNRALKSFYKQFPSEQACIDYLEVLRWPDGPLCPHCSSLKSYKFLSARLFKCAGCKKQFTVKAGTIFADSHIPIQDWMMAIYMLTSHPVAISSIHLASQLEITQKSAWLMLRRIRYAMEYQTQHEIPALHGSQPKSGLKREKPYKIEISSTEALKKIVLAPKPEKKLG